MQLGEQFSGYFWLLIAFDFAVHHQGCLRCANYWFDGHSLFDHGKCAWVKRAAMLVVSVCGHCNHVKKCAMLCEKNIQKPWCNDQRVGVTVEDG